jgi:hypothetical protein
LAQGQKIGHHLARMMRVGQAIDDWNRRRLSHALNDLVFVSTNHHSVTVATQDLSDIFWLFAFASRRQALNHVSASFLHRSRKAYASAKRWLIKKKSQALACEISTRAALLSFVSKRLRKIKKSAELVSREFFASQNMFGLQSEHKTQLSSFWV